MTSGVESKRRSHGRTLPRMARPCTALPCVAVPAGCVEQFPGRGGVSRLHGRTKGVLDDHRSYAAQPHLAQLHLMTVLRATVPTLCCSTIAGERKRKYKNSIIDRAREEGNQRKVRSFFPFCLFKHPFFLTLVLLLLALPLFKDFFTSDTKKTSNGDKDRKHLGRAVLEKEIVPLE